MTGTNRASGWSFQHAGLARRPGLVLMVTLLLAFLCSIYTANHLRIDTDTTDMIAEEVAFRQNELAFRKAFPAFKETIVAVIDGDTPERAEEAAADLAAALRADDQRFVRVFLLGDDPFFKRNGLLYFETETLETLSDRLAEAQPLLAALAADPNLRGLADFIRLVLEKAEDPVAAGEELDQLFLGMAAAVDAALEDRPGELSWRRLLDLNARMSGARRLVLIEPRLDYGSLTPGAEAIGKVRAAAADLAIDPAHGLTMRLTGSAVLEDDELKTASGGALWAGLLATTGVAILLVIGLGSIRLIAATLITLAVGLIITAGLAALLIGRLNLISVTFAVLFVGLGVDFGIHLTLRYKEALRHQPGHAQALRDALKGVGGPLTLSAICAGLGFIAFVPTDYQGLAELGMISAMGMAVAWAMSLTLLPALLTLMPPAAAAGPKPESMTRRETDGERPRAVAWTARYANIILGLALVLTVSAMPVLLKVSFDFNPLNLKDPNSESVATFLDLERNPETTANVINLLAANQAEADRLAARLSALPETGDVITLKSFVPKDQEDKLAIIDEMAFFLGPLAPDETELTPDARRSAFIALLKALESSAKDGVAGDAESGLHRLRQSLAAKTGPTDDRLLDLDQRLTRHLPDLLNQLDQALQPDEVDLDSIPASLRDPWVNEAGEARILVRPAIGINNNRALARFADAALAAAPGATGAPIIITQAGRAVVGAFVKASWIALALITALLLLTLRRIGDVLLVLAPLALAIVFTGATSVLLGLDLNFANVIVLPLLLGLGVSGAIHVVMRRHQDQRRGDADKGPPATGASTSRAVLFSALTTVASFGSLALSSHQGMASMGLLLTVAILWSLICTLIILPALLSLFGPGRESSF